MKHAFVFLLLVIALLQTLSAYMYDPASLRSLAIDASLIIEGEPVGAEPGIMPEKFKVSQVLKGEGHLTGTTIKIIDQGELKLTSFWERDELGKPVTRGITKALLFLTESKDADGKPTHVLLLSGIRAISSKGEVLLPVQFMNPGPLTLSTAFEGMHGWDEIIARVRDDMPKIERILAMEKIADPAERNRVVLAWIKSHKDEFGGGYWEGNEKGWAQIEWMVFEWVLATCIPDDAWRATELAVELNVGSRESFPSFCSPRGRELLLEKVFDPAVDEKIRLKALRELNGAIWYPDEKRYPGIRRVTPEEQVRVIERMIPLLDHPQAAWRLEAARVVFEASYPGDSNYNHRIDKRAVPRLTERYKVERDAEVREELVDALLHLEDVAYWEKLTGNPGQLAVSISLSDHKPEGMEFGVRQLQYAKATITEVPEFVFEKLDEKGVVGESHSAKSVALYPEKLFVAGWDNGDQKVLRVQPPGLSPGNWRVTLRGTIKGRAWHSEPLEIVLPLK